MKTLVFIIERIQIKSKSDKTFHSALGLRIDGQLGR